VNLGAVSRSHRFDKCDSFPLLERPRLTESDDCDAELGGER